MPSQVQLTGESNNGLSVESLNLNGNGAQPEDGLATTEPPRPQLWTHPPTPNNGHVDSFNVFFEDINSALSGALSRNGIIYTKVSVLFLRWKDDVFIDPGNNNGVQGEIDNLERVLTEAYGFETEHYLIPSQDSQRSLQREIFHFQEVHTSRDELLMVYYGGHGQLNRMDQSVWSQGKNGASVDWFSIQHLLENAVPDVLIILDCCYAASADQRSVDGTVEILAACGHETKTVGISDWSFTNRLTEVLQDLKDQRFTVAQLHSKLVNYRAVKGPRKLLKTPHHGIMSNKDKASIRISALKCNSAINELEDIDMTMSEGSEQSESISPRVLIAVSVRGNPDATSWRDWLLSQLPTGIEGLSLVKPEGIFGSHSTVGVFSLPVALWDLLPERSAYKFVSFVTTPNLITQITDPTDHPIGNPSDVDHTASVHSWPSEPHTMENPSLSGARSMDPKTQDSSIKTTVSSQTMSSAQDDTLFGSIDHPDNLIPVRALAQTVVQLYSAVKTSFKWHSESYILPESLGYINVCFFLEGQRLRLWADLWHLDHVQLPEAILDDLNWGIFKSSELILREMQNLFRWIPRKPHPPSGSELSGGPDSASETQTDVKPTKTPFDLGIPPQKRVEYVVKQLKYFNDCLENSSTLSERTSLRYRLRTFCVREQVSRLGMIQNAAALLGHKDIEQWTKARSVFERQLDEGNKSGVIFRIDQKDLTDAERILEGGQLRSSATYNGDRILVDWYQSTDWYNSSGSFQRTRPNAIIAFLCQDLRSLNLSIPRCVGYVEGLRDRIGCVFVMPSKTIRTELHHLIHPEGVRQQKLNDRFKLANALARTIFGMHTLGWCHGNISTKNIIICSQDDQAEAGLCNPYLLGFGIHRHDTARRRMILEEHSHVNDDFHYYRHPEVRHFLKKIQIVSFTPSYDIYSLGIVLWEIGTWKLLTDMPSYKYHEKTITRLKSSNSHPKMTDLRAQMGHRYTNVVIACLDESFDKIWRQNLDNDPRQLQDHLREFQEKIVDPLAACSV